MAFAHPHVIPNPHDFYSSQKETLSKMFKLLFTHTMKPKKALLSTKNDNKKNNAS